MDYDEIESLKFELEDQTLWWENNAEELDAEQKGELVDWIIDEGKFDYFDLLIEITIDNIERPEKFGDDLQRISPSVNDDLAWGRLTKSIRENIEGREQLAEDIYQELVEREDGWLKWVGGVALGHCADGFVQNNVSSLLSSEDPDEVSAGLQALSIKYEGVDELPESYVEELEELSNRDDERVIFDLIGTCSTLIEEQPDLWNLVKDIGHDSPGTIAYILRVYNSKITDEQLESFLELAKTGIESDQSVDFSQVSYYLHARFSHKVNTLSEFIIWLTDYKPIEASRLAKEIAKENNEFWGVLVEHRDEFSNNVYKKQVLDNTATFVDEEIQELQLTLDAAFHEDDPNKKGELLENAAEQFINLVENVQHARNVESAEEEIDIMVHNRRTDQIGRWGTPILIECRNRQESVQAKHVRDFGGKILNQPTETGFFIARNGFTAGAEEQVQDCLSWPNDGIKITMIPMDDLLKLTDSGEIPSLLMDKYDQIYE
ncbi:restriction endonuclease [Halorubrum sp. GN11GM_10-3_MGM]|uniref:restriction endonuclease n=1 Tax=Halorubrum sp. GN11GM_10-3_MGM TaxID=2518111 RepID=UPI0013052C6C|nr:restriction endonuclease [Halorubrum sp. GN11GM_10-3_MGM]